MPAQFKKGLFLHIVSKDKKKWSKDIKKLAGFKYLDFVEMWIERIDLNSQEIAWLKQKLSHYEIIIHAPFINLTLVSAHDPINKATMDIFKKTIDTAEQLGAKIVTMHAGSFPLFMSISKARRMFAANFQQLMDYAEKKVSIAIENISAVKNTQISYPVLLGELTEIKQLIPNIVFTLDAGHCVQNNDDFEKFLKINKKQIKNIHLHNAIKGGYAHFGFNKQGDLNLCEFIDLLEKNKYNNYLSLEVLGERDIKESWNILLKCL